MDVPCFTPLEGYVKQPEPGSGKATGGFTTSRHNAFTDQPMKVPCGQCIGCRLERSRQWAIRCVHENQMHADSCFVTLTYDDDNLPPLGSLDKTHVQLFMKRLRRSVGPVRVFYCGEYGDTTGRPHYHALLFGWRPDDPSLFRSGDGEFPLYESPTLTERWGLGFANFGEVNFETAAYTARYVTKKITGDAAEAHYQVIDPETGEILGQREPEFNGMSRRPGIGLPWLAKYGRDAYTKDEVILRNRAMKPPRAYDKVFEVTDPSTWRTIRAKRGRDRQVRYPTMVKDRVGFTSREHSKASLANLKKRPDDFNHYKARDKIARAKLEKGKL